jgi:hypothetical protein
MKMRSEADGAAHACERMRVRARRQCFERRCSFERGRESSSSRLTGRSRHLIVLARNERRHHLQRMKQHDETLVASLTKRLDTSR